MPAKIIQTNQKPFNWVDVEPITLDIIENALRNARTEMDAVLFRTAMSPGIREQHDAFPMIANSAGKMVVGQFGSFIWGFTQGYNGDIEEGDIFLTNDPYSCDGAVSHLNDWLTMKPIFRDGRLVAWARDVRPSDRRRRPRAGQPADRRAQIFEEGIQIPPVKIFKKGELNKEVLNLLLRNTRTEEWNRSDFNAIVAALRLAERRVHEICDRFGDDVFYSAMEDMLDRNFQAMKAIIHMVIPESQNKFYFEDYIDDDGIGMGPTRSPAACGAKATSPSSTSPARIRNR